MTRGADDGPTWASRAVMVRVTGPDPRGVKTRSRAFFKIEAGKTSLSCSGFVLRVELKSSSISVATTTTLVATSAWLVAPFLREDSNVQMPSTVETLPGTAIDVCDEKGSWTSARLVTLARPDAECAKLLAGLLGTSPLTKMRGVEPLDLAVLALSTSSVAAAPIASPLNDIAARPRRGQDLIVVASIFGLVSPSVFRNSVTRGCVSNILGSASESVAGSQPRLILTDARCLAGSEGAPVFDASGRLLGVVVPSLTRPDNSALELGVVLPARVAWTALRRALAGIATLLGDDDSGGSGDDEEEARLSPHSVRSPAGMVGNNVHIEAALHGLVLIRVDGTWGSGALVSRERGLVLTCAHVVRGSRDNSALVTFMQTHDTHSGPARDSTRLASIAYRSEGPLDVALLRVSDIPASAREASLYFGPPHLVPGQVVYALGHAVFDPAGVAGCSPTVSRGTLCRSVVVAEGSSTSSRSGVTPVLWQTSALVFRGHSGGMLCDDLGRLVGVLTSNAKHSDGSIIPEINFVVPLAAVRSVVEFARDDVKELRRVFDAPNEALRALWALEPVDLAPVPGIRPTAEAFAEFLGAVDPAATRRGRL